MNLRLLGLFLASCSPAYGLVLQRSALSTRYQLPSCVRAGRPVCGWGPDPIWSTLSIKSTEAACEGSQSVVISVPEAAAAEYKAAGQYVQIRAGEDAKPSFFAIASAPASGTDWEFLIKETDGSKWFTTMPEGASVQVSQVMGGGFKIADELNSMKSDFPCQQVVLFAVGAGIAPIRAAIEQEGEDGLNLSSGRSCKLYYGAQTPAKMAYQDKFADWKARGVEVVPVISKPDGTGWEGKTGYIQEVAKADGIATPRNTGVLLCGMKEMAIAVKEVCGEAGVAEERVLTNF